MEKGKEIPKGLYFYFQGGESFIADASLREKNTQIENNAEWVALGESAIASQIHVQSFGS